MSKFALALLLACAGCAQLEQKVEMDTAAAAEIAKAVGDSQGATCWPAVGTLFSVPAAGLASKYELVRGAQIIAEGPCAPLFAGFTLHFLNKVPGTP